LERLYLENTHHKKGLVEWLKVEALKLSPGTKKKNYHSQSPLNADFSFLTESYIN
jgi:hypothetical protein